MLGPTPADDRTPPMTPQLALRVALVGGLALLMFAVIFFRLWFLQVLTGTQYAAQAQSQTVLSIPVPAPRGEIVDASGQPLVQSVPVPSIQIAPRSLPGGGATLDLQLKHPVVIPQAAEAVMARLAKLLGMSATPTRCSYTVYIANKGPEVSHVRLSPIACLVAQSVAQSQYGNATIKTDVPTYIQDYIGERQTEFPGVVSQDTYQLKYALGTAGAQLFGYLSQVTPAEIKDKIYKSAQAGDIVGQSGLEEQYNQYLQGVNGSEGVKVNAQGQFEGYAKATAPLVGDTLKLSLNAALEKVGQQALATSIKANSSLGADGGSFVAIDPQNGQIYAMGSSPTYNPASIANGIPTKEWAFLNNPANHEPLLNRAIQGAFPDGSTFKPVTATAALETGVWKLGQTFNDYPGRLFCLKGAPCLSNAGHANYGVVDLQTAIEVSDDEFFYNLGRLLNGNPANYPKGFPLQAWARRYGLGQVTGVDLPGESPGLIGSPTLQTALWKQELECQNATGPYKGDPKHPAVMGDFGNEVLSGGCGIANASYWTIDDNVETGVGQYDDQVTPIQLAVVYSAVENGGTIVTPHIGSEIQSPTGTLVQNINPAPKRKLNINPAYLTAIQQGLYLAAKGPQGTSTDVMSSLPLPVYGKTGSAELNATPNGPTDGWYACYVPGTATRKPIVVVVDIERGGYGTSSAAPVARQILSQFYFGKPGPMVGLG